MKKSALFLIFLFLSSMLWAQQKYALVIGNAAYTGAPWKVLPNPVNDANSMEEALNDLGFKVAIVRNGTKEEMEWAVINFRLKLNAARASAYGFFYYAGHGAQHNGENYLIPADAKTPRLEDLEANTMSVGFVMQELELAKNELNMIVLDACRDLPDELREVVTRGSRSPNEIRGLANIIAPQGTVIMYATAANKTASDGDGRGNGLFTTYLLKNLRTQGLSVFEVFDKTMGDVINFTKGIQHPEFSLRFSGAASTYLGSRNYKIGDSGPAGGIVFYDKGNADNGWRYLEVAPVNTEFRAQWGAYEKDVRGTSTAIGAGKQNTWLIADFLKTTGENRTAAQLCADMNYGGFNDWFLPSMDELDLIYNNLVQKNLGSFKRTVDMRNKTHIYWSSSQHGNYVSWTQHFSDGIQNYATNLGKEDTFSVRAIRSF